MFDPTGKSTFLRQNALIAILAQAGSFVPAQSATIGKYSKHHIASYVCLFFNCLSDLQIFEPFSSLYCCFHQKK